MAILASALFCLVLTAPPPQSPPAASDAPPQTDQRAPQDVKPEDPDKPPTPPHTGVRAIFIGLKDDITHLPSKENLFVAAIGGGLALGTHPFDQSLNARSLNQSDAVNKIFAPAKYYGNTPEQLGLSIGVWVIGRVMDKPKLSHLGMDLLRAQALTEMMVEPIKLATHRERPDGSNRMSFPSGHAAITFAAAAVIERHLGWKNSIIAYGIASYVATSRLHDNQHYLSDVVFGAAVGSIAGRTVTQHGRDMWTLGPMAVPGGMMIGATKNYQAGTKN
jgi:hypothetical protein